jgi:ATP-binding cassette subfamily F protein 3
MLVVSNVSKRFHLDTILKNISFTVNAGERAGIVGPNGTGKTTLLRIITGELSPDSGSVQFVPTSLRVGYLPQGLAVDDSTPLEDVLYPQLQALRDAETDVERLGAALADADEDYDQVMTEYSDTLERLEYYSRRVPSGEGEAILAGLGLAEFDLSTPVGILSGGQKTRLMLASLLVNDPQLLILDEPTNHLDVTALEWLESWLSDFDSGALIVSHDRTFLDRTVNSIISLDESSHTTREYPGNYRDYVEAVRSERDKQWAQWQDQQAEITRLKYDMERTMARAVRKENATNNDVQRRYAKKVAKRAKAKETRLKRYMESDERVDKPEHTWSLKLDFGELPTTGRDVVHLENVTAGYKVPLLPNLDLTVRAGERVIVLGQNGHGKSTLLKTIIGELEPLGGRVHIGTSVKIGYLAQEQDTLDLASNPLEALLSEVSMSNTDARSFLHYFLFGGDEVFRPIHLLSYGERTRLMLAILVARGSNLLVLDEPINHLDIPSRELFEAALSNFKGSVIAVVHDRYFVDKFADTVWQVENGTIHVEIREPMMG